MHEMWTIVIDGPGICLSVAKAAERIDFLFGVVTPGITPGSPRMLY